MKRWGRLQPWTVGAALAALIFSACGGGGGGGEVPPPARPPAPAPNPTGTVSPQSCSPASPTPPPANAFPSPRPASGLSVPAGLTISIVGNVSGAREIAFAPNGDLFVGTQQSTIYVVPYADSASSNPAPAKVFADLRDAPAAGVAVNAGSQDCAVYVGTQFAVYRIPYNIGDQTAHASPVKIASVRPGGPGGHSTTSVAVSGSTLYVSIGSSCDACTETDPTRATIQQLSVSGGSMTAKAVHIRNAIALAVNPNTGTLWAGGAGQDSLPQGHPYEYFDGVTLHGGVADYGWPGCEENHVAYRRGADCSGTVVPLVEFPAYETIIGAALYPSSSSGAHHLPQQYAGGAFVAMHGSWHMRNGVPAAPPRVAFVPMKNDSPVTPVDWSDPTKQWSDFVSGFQRADGSRIGRPTGVAVGPQGDLFVADAYSGNIYRIRP